MDVEERFEAAGGDEIKKKKMKVVDLFGNVTETTTTKKKKKKTLFDDYDGFVDKFETKLTTDDCYTPDGVYKCVLDWLGEKVDLKGKRIVRPFYPGGDFENEIYEKDDVVVDNPPFSIITKIVRFYVSEGVKFFLFAPHLTLFSPGKHCTSIVVGADVIYENGAHVKTSFVSNLFDAAIICEGDLHERLEAFNERTKLNKYEYNRNVITVSRLQRIVERGGSMEIKKEEIFYIGKCDADKRGKGLFGGGYLCNDRIAEARIKAEAEARRTIIYELSDAEKKIIEKLNKV